MSPEDDLTPIPTIIAKRLAIAAERLLMAWGAFEADWQRRLVERITAAAAEAAAQPPRDADRAAREALDILLARWASALAEDAGPAPIDALRAAFLAIDGARCWPDQFLEARPGQDFRQDLRRALPRPLPAGAPLEMPEQPL